MEPTADKKAAVAGDKEPKKWKVTLAGRHEHGDATYKAGDVITVRDDQVKRLEGRELVKSKVPA